MVTLCVAFCITLRRADAESQRKPIINAYPLGWVKGI